MTHYHPYRHPVGRAAAHVGRHVGCRTVKSRLPSNRLLNGPLDVVSAIFLFQYLFLQFFNKILLFGKNPDNSDTPAIRALAEHWQTASAAAALVSISHLQMRQTRQDLKHFSLLISHLLRLYSVFFFTKMYV